LWVGARPTNVQTVFDFHYDDYLKAKQTKRSDRQVYRVTCYSGTTKAADAVNPTVLLATATYTTGGAKNLMWSGEAIYKFLKFPATTGTVTYSGIEMELESVDITITGTGTFSITVEVWGCEFSSLFPDATGESVSDLNVETNDGQAVEIVNPLILDDAEAKDISEAILADYEVPRYDIELEFPYTHPMLEVGDAVRVISDVLYEESTYEIVGINYDYTEDVKKTSTLFLSDTTARKTRSDELLIEAGVTSSVGRLPATSAQVTMPAGSGIINNSAIEWAQENIAISAAAADKHRIDILCVDESGALSIVAGSEVNDVTTNPPWPTIPTNKMQLGCAYVTDAGIPDLNSGNYAAFELRPDNGRTDAF